MPFKAPLWAFLLIKNMIVEYTGVYLFKTKEPIGICSMLNDSEILIIKERGDSSIYKLYANKIKLEHSINVRPFLLKSTSSKEFDFDKL